MKSKSLLITLKCLLTFPNPVKSLLFIAVHLQWTVNKFHAEQHNFGFSSLRLSIYRTENNFKIWVIEVVLKYSPNIYFYVYFFTKQEEKEEKRRQKNVNCYLFFSHVSMSSFLPQDIASFALDSVNFHSTSRRSTA